MAGQEVEEDERREGPDGGDEGRDLQLVRCKEGLGKHRVKGKLRHPPAKLGELPEVVEGAEGVELLKGAEEGLGRRRVHEVEVHEVVDAKALG